MAALLFFGLVASRMGLFDHLQTAADVSHATPNTLHVSWRDPVSNPDPYYNQERNGFALAHEVWDTLIDRDPASFQFKPLLALSWSKLSDTEYVFQLRPHVRFHDGTPFGADDVVYTINTVVADPRVAVPGNYAFLQGAEKIDDLTVRLRLRYPFAPALDIIAMALPIWPKATRIRLGAAGFARTPVGTGPYRISHVAPDRIELRRNTDYFSGAKGKPAIETIRIHTVGSMQAEVDDLIAGRADWIWMFDVDRIGQIEQSPGLDTMRSDTMRIAFLALRSNGPPDAPLSQQTVRQAIFHAVDRAALSEGARLLDAPCYPTQFGCDQAVATHYGFDLTKAKQMLVDAGWQNGFDVTLASIISSADTERLQRNLEAVGIRTRVVTANAGDASRQIGRSSVSMFAGSWGSYSINDVSATLPQFFGGPNDLAHNTEIADLVRAGNRATDPDIRRHSYADALRIITDQAYVLPLYAEKTTYAADSALAFRPLPDDLPRFYAMRWTGDRQHTVK